MTLPMQAIKTFGFIPELIASRSSDGAMRIEGVGSSTVRDHHGDTFSLKALRKMASASEGMVVFMNHGYEVPKDVFGKIEVVRLNKTGEIDQRTKQEIWDLRLGMIVAQSNPLAVENFDLIDKDKINLGISVGAMLPEGGYEVDKSIGGRLLIDDIEPIEFSMVGLPANPRSFVDYAVKSIVGVYPDSKKFNIAWDRFLVKASESRTEDEDDEGAADDDAAEAPEITESDDIPPRPLDPGEIAPDEQAGLELEPGDVGELTVKEDGTVESKLVAKAGTPEAEQWHHDNMGEMLVREVHPDLEKGKKTHQHPHAHTHDHEHTHGYGDSMTVHAHEHAHQHSHDHGADHPHEDDQNNYEHNHPHNGSWSDEEHAHGDGAVKSDKDLEALPLQPLVQKTKVTVWEDGDTGSKTVEVNTGRSKPKADGEDQSVQDSLSPDTTGGRGDAEGDDEDPDVTAALAVVSKSNDSAADLLKKVLGQNSALKTEVVDLRRERDTAIEIGLKAMNNTREILKRVGELPVGRKAAGFTDIKGDFDDLSEIYGEDVRQIMTKKR